MATTIRAADLDAIFKRESITNFASADNFIDDHPEYQAAFQEYCDHLTPQRRLELVTESEHRFTNAYGPGTGHR